MKSSTAGEGSMVGASSAVTSLVSRPSGGLTTRLIVLASNTVATMPITTRRMLEDFHTFLIRSHSVGLRRCRGKWGVLNAARWAAALLLAGARFGLAPLAISICAVGSRWNAPASVSGQPIRFPSAAGVGNPCDLRREITGNRRALAYNAGACLPGIDAESGGQDKIRRI